jgi:hypothetical protein
MTCLRRCRNEGGPRQSGTGNESAQMLTAQVSLRSSPGVLLKCLLIALLNAAGEA